MANQSRRSAVPFKMDSSVLELFACFHCNNYLVDSFTHQKCQHTVCGLCSYERRDKSFCRRCEENPDLGGPFVSLSLASGRNKLIDKLAKWYHPDKFERRLDALKATDMRAHLSAIRPPPIIHRSKATLNSAPRSIHEAVVAEEKKGMMAVMKGVGTFWMTPSFPCCIGMFCCCCFLHPMVVCFIEMLRRLSRCFAAIAVFLVFCLVVGIVNHLLTGSDHVETVLNPIFPSLFQQAQPSHVLNLTTVTTDFRHV